MDESQLDENEKKLCVKNDAKKQCFLLFLFKKNDNILVSLNAGCPFFGKKFKARFSDNQFYLKWVPCLKCSFGHTKKFFPKRKKNYNRTIP